VQLLDLIFPPRCGGCGRHGVAWCDGCAASVQPPRIATLNGVPLVAAGQFDGPLQHAIHTYKYRPRPGLAGVLAEPLRRAIVAARLDLGGLIAIPLHPQRRRERGFNQAERLAAALAGPLGLPVVGGLRRVRPTPAQVGLSQPERQANMMGAFVWNAATPPPRGLALVDDVCTTGATLEAAADAVVRAGGSIRAFLVLARAQTLPALAVTFPERG
jgi:ComF family protein